jgi:hypothetical protein
VIVELNWEGDDLDNAGILEEAEEPLVVAAPDRDRGVIVVRFGKTIEDALATADNGANVSLCGKSCWRFVG